MTEPTRLRDEALSHVQAAWDGARTERTLPVLAARHRRRRRRRLGATAAGLGAAICAASLWLVYPMRAPDPGAATVASQHEAGAPLTADGNSKTGGSRTMRLPDGSRVELLHPRTRATLERSSDHLLSLRLTGGPARFKVTHDPDRVFRVHTQHVWVEVLGTVFEVEPREDRTHVRVQRGRVAVRWGEEDVELSTGERRWFPEPTAEVGVQGAASLTEPRTRRTPPASAPGRNRVAPSWQDHAEQGEFGQAFRLLPRRAAPSSMDVDDLMLAADAARLSGHPKAALPYLRRVIAHHPQDARSPLAAFTLGGVLMHQLGLPREAEGAYALARATTDSPALAQDALARQVEAAHRAGDEALARGLARTYLTAYPEGRRVRAVRQFGGL